MKDDNDNDIFTAEFHGDSLTGIFTLQNEGDRFNYEWDSLKFELYERNDGTFSSSFKIWTIQEEDLDKLINTLTTVKQKLKERNTIYRKREEALKKYKSF